MKRAFWGAFGGVLLLASAWVHAAELDADPLRRHLGSIGYYANGCFDAEGSILTDETGLHKLFIERRRGYGNPEMLELLRALGLAYHQDWQLNGTPAKPYERLQLGDIAQAGGGPISKHASHQTGLDVDIAYLRRDFREMKADRGFDASFDEKFVHNHKVTPNLDIERMWWVWKWLQRSGKVDRIFVDKEIKRYFCRHGAELEAADRGLRTEILRMLRPYPDHDDHFHVRLICPAGDSRCITQPPVPLGSGCRDEEIDAESGEMEDHKPHPANEPSLVEAPPPQPAPESHHHLPAECKAIVHHVQ